MIPGLFKPGNSKAIALKNSEAIDIDATTYSEKQKTKQKNPKKMLQNLKTYSEKQKTKNKTKKPKKMLQNLKTKFFMLQLNSAQYIRHWNQQEFQNTSIE